jgi:hypothetical protein
LSMYVRLQSRCTANADVLTVARPLGDGRTINGNGLRHRVGSCCVAAGYLTSLFSGIADHARTCRWPTRSKALVRAARTQ